MLISLSYLLSMVGFHSSLTNTRHNKLFNIQFYTTNYSLASYFPRVLANKIANFGDFFFMSREVFKFNIYHALTNHAF